MLIPLVDLSLLINTENVARTACQCGSAIFSGAVKSEFVRFLSCVPNFGVGRLHPKVHVFSSAQEGHVCDGKGLSRRLHYGVLWNCFLRPLQAGSGTHSASRRGHQGLGEAKNATNREYHHSPKAVGPGQATFAK